MGNCQICNIALRSLSSPCHNCGWPTGAIEAITRQNLQREALDWIRKVYQETLRSAPGVSLPPSSRMNAQIGGSHGAELSKSDLVALGNRVRRTEEQQLKSEVEANKLLQKSQTLEQGIQKVTKSISDMNSFFHQQNDRNIELDDQSKVTQKSLEDCRRQFQDLIREQQRQAGEISMLKSVLTNRSVSQSTSVASASAVSMNAPIVSMAVMNSPGLSFTTEELDLLREYNGNAHEVPKSLRDRSTNVSTDDEAVVRIRDGDGSNITFKFNRSGNYLVIPRGGYCYLVPNKQRRMITQIYTVTKAIYKCDGYSEGYKDFRLIKPALVSEESIDCWKLSQQGILEFI
jgi:hypothetical protein